LGRASRSRRSDASRLCGVTGQLVRVSSFCSPMLSLCKPSGQERLGRDRLAGLAGSKAVAHGFEAGEHVQRGGRSRLAEPAAKPASSGSAHDEHVALGAVNDLRADGPQQQPLDRIEPAAAHHDEVGVLGPVEDHVAWVALRLERLRVDAARR
jgi:hypothetical protein